MKSYFIYLRARWKYRKEIRYMIKGFLLKKSSLMDHEVQKLMKADFIKKAIGRTTFTCTDGEKLFGAVNAAVATKDPQVQTVSTSGCDINGEIVAQFEFTWSFKQRQLDH